jgi:hypothetical protein
LSYIHQHHMFCHTGICHVSSFIFFTVICMIYYEDSNWLVYNMI